MLAAAAATEKDQAARGLLTRSNVANGSGGGSCSPASEVACRSSVAALTNQFGGRFNSSCSGGSSRVMGALGGDAAGQPARASTGGSSSSSNSFGRSSTGPDVAAQISSTGGGSSGSSSRASLQALRRGVATKEEEGQPDVTTAGSSTPVIMWNNAAYEG